jgi:DNA invertase Pin-like site-specific DNA recombinase
MIKPPVGLRAAAYIRVSSEERLEGHSLDAQRRAINALERHRGIRDLSAETLTHDRHGAGEQVVHPRGNVRDQLAEAMRRAPRMVLQRRSSRMI